jgi:acyl-CoA synthetase (AMP-forming)/AMP-acid ligase II
MTEATQKTIRGGVPANPTLACPPFPTYVERLRWWAVHEPTSRAFAFTRDGVTDEDVTTFERLEFLVRRTAAVLQDVARPGDRVLNLCSPGVHFQASLYAPLFAEQVVVPFVLPRPGQSPATLAAVIGRVRPATLLVTSDDIATIDAVKEAIPALEDIRVIVTDELPDEVASTWREVVPDPDGLACISLTSGSTSIPQCVMRTHRGLLNTLDTHPEIVSQDRSPRLALGAPHTMAGIAQSLPVVHAGAPTIFMSISDVLAHPVGWLRALARPGVRGGGTGNHIMDLCVRAVTEDEKKDIDLSRVEGMVVVGEETQLPACRRFAEAFAVCGFSFDRFLCAYGMSEASGISFPPLGQGLLLTTLSREALEVGRVEIVPENSPKSRTVLSQGQPLPSQSVRVVDPVTCVECPPNRVGEIWVSGPTVASGYWDQPKETERTFHAHIAGTGEGPFLRTGDLGFLLDGNLYVIDRVKDVVIIRGRNLSPGDIEGHMRAAHPDLVGHGGVACGIKVDGDERLLVVQETLASTAERYAEMSRAVRTAVARELGVQPHDVVLLPAGSLPRTESGKVQRAETRRQYEGGVLPALYQETRDDRNPGESVDGAAPSEVEEMILDIWRRVLGHESISIHDSFASVGGDSFSAMRVLAGIRRAGFSLSVNDLWRGETVAELARLVRPDDADRDDAERVVGPHEPVALTVGQSQILRTFNPVHVRHTMISSVVAPTEPLDVDILRAAIDTVVAAHEGLRTRFENDGGVVRPVMQERVETPLLQVVDLSENGAAFEQRLAGEISAARGRISFEHGPVVQCLFIRSDNPATCRFVAVVHHLVSDALSIQIVLEDIETAYRAIASGDAPRIVRTTSPGEYARQLDEYIHSPQYAADLTFWEGDAEVTEISEIPAPLWPVLPSARPSRARVAMRTILRVPGMRPIAYALYTRLRQQPGSRVTFGHVLEADTSTRLLDAAAQQSISPVAVIVYALTQAVYRVAGSTEQRHVIVGYGRAPVRPETDLSRTVSMFTANYPLAFHIEPYVSRVDALRAVKRRLESVPTGGLAGALPSVGSRTTSVTEPEDGVPRLTINFQGTFSTVGAGLFARPPVPQIRREMRIDTSGNPDIWIHCRVRDRCISFDIRHPVALYSPSLVDRLIATSMDELRDLEAELLRDRVAPVDVHGRV